MGSEHYWFVMGSKWVRNGFVFLRKFRDQFFVTPCKIAICRKCSTLKNGFVCHKRVATEGTEDKEKENRNSI